MPASHRRKQVAAVAALLLVAGAVWFIHAAPGWAAMGTTAWQGDRFVIDTPNVVRRSDVVLGQPNTAATQFMPLGNGTLGAAVWAAGICVPETMLPFAAVSGTAATRARHLGPVSIGLDAPARTGRAISLRSNANEMYVCAENAGALPLIANRSAVQLWETFQLVHNPDGSVSLRALVNNDFVTAEQAGAQPLIANRTAIGGWEEFDLIND
jgi:hypothetical protein